MKLLPMAVRSLYNNPLRTFLSALGVIIGVATIVLVIAIGLGAQKSIEEQYANLAVTSILVNPVSTPSQKSKLSEDDVPILESESNNVRSASAILQGKLLSTGDV
jgi:ABC-type antimicrobial peptide transport system permease subunit